MKGGRRACALGAVAAAFAAVTSLSASALADTPPSVWDRARDPAVEERYKLHLQAQVLMSQAEPSNPLKNLFLERARAELEGAGAGQSPDVRLRFDLGDVYYRLDRYREAIQTLQPALALAPHHTAAPEAWIDLAYAAAKLDRSLLELDAYDEALASGIQERGELSILSNRAEAEMRLGDLDAAVTGYRDVLDRAEHVYGIDPDIPVLARWGLAVALDRNHDPAQAEHEALRASEEDPEEKVIGDRDKVFFVPEYERDWYYALGRTQHAKHATSPEEALVCWDLVVATWGHYVASAAQGDRWVGLAGARLAAAGVERRRAAALYAKTAAGAAGRTPRRRRRPC